MVLLTNSDTSSFKLECTPIRNGVGVARTSDKPAGSSGMYTWAYRNGNIRAASARHAAASRAAASDTNSTLCSLITANQRVTELWIPENKIHKFHYNFCGSTYFYTSYI